MSLVPPRIPALPASRFSVILVTVVYVLSGVSQPLLVTMAKAAGLTDPSCQLYMLPYFLGPALLFPCSGFRFRDYSGTAVMKTAGVATMDIASGVMNYTGSAMCGPTIFAIIYSSVTVWAAIFSTLILSRYMNAAQWAGVTVVFVGLAITALDSIAVGSDVFRGSCLVLVGSTLHAVIYVLSEVLLTTGEKLPVVAYCAVLCVVSSSIFIAWQLAFTLPRFDALIGGPMRDAGTSPLDAVAILCAIGAANLVHALSFFYTLKHAPGGAVSTGVLKGLSAVLVFVVCHVAFCGRGDGDGGSEMCFTWTKLSSLVVVVGGVLLYGKATEAVEIKGAHREVEGGGYEEITDVAELELRS